MPTMIDKEAIEMSTIYSIRLKVDSSDKESYSKEELLRFLDEIAREIKSESSKL